MPLLIVALSALLSIAGDAASVVPDVAKPSHVAAASAQADEDETSDVAHQTYRIFLTFSLKNSASPRNWALASQLLGQSGVSLDAWIQQRGALLRKAAQAVPKDRLVQWMWASAEPRVSGCDVQHPCPDRAVVFAKLEPDNGTAWVPVFNAAWNAKDISAAESALSQIAQATRFDEPIGDEFKAWEDVFHDFPAASLVRPLTPYEKVETSKAGMAFIETIKAPFPAYNLLVRACTRAKQPDASTTRFKDCGKVGRLMLGRSTQFFGRVMGGFLIRVSGTADAKDVEAGRLMRWQYEQFWNVFAHMSSDAKVFGDYLADFEETGSDVETTQKAMHRTGTPLIPSADWRPTNSKGEPIDPLDQRHASMRYR